MMRGLAIPVAMVRDEVAVVVDDDHVLVVVVSGVRRLSERWSFLHGTTRVMGTTLETLIELSLDRRTRTAIPSS
jgi:hypothetical protein